MKTLKVRLLLTALAVLAFAAVNHGCSENSGPTGPGEPTGGAFAPLSMAVTDCGTSDYFTDLTPVLVGWEDSLEAWLGEGLLDSLPVYTAGTAPQAHLEILVPGLQQWEGAINGELDSLVVDSVAVFDPDVISVPGYLVGLSDLLAQWKSSLETLREIVFLATPPVFSPDTTAPVIECPSDMTFECVDSSGIEIVWPAIVSDNCDPSPQVTYDPPLGTVIRGNGEVLVTCTAVDSSGNSSECSYTITTWEVTPPVIECLPDTTIECNGVDGTVFDFEVTATSDCDTLLTIACDPPPGSAFPNGTTTVTCIVTDSYGLADTCTFDVTVEDTTPPVIEDAYATPGELWPPNHKMVDVNILVDIMEACDELPDCYIADVTSNEDVNGIGDGNTEPDWIITGNLSVQLRAERAGPESGRIYYIHLVCEDDAGNSTDHTVEVTVPHDQGIE
jgi:hypothetical protein